MADGRSLGEAWRAIDELRAERREYVRRDVYDARERTRDAERDADRRRLTVLETHDTSQAASGKAWVLGLGLAAAGAVFGFIAQLLSARGGH